MSLRFGVKVQSQQRNTHELKHSLDQAHKNTKMLTVQWSCCSYDGSGNMQKAGFACTIY